MNHPPDLDRLSALVEGRLDAAERAGVLAHLAACRECREIVGVLTASVSPAAPARAIWQRPAIWLPIAATLAVASVSVLLLRPPAPPSLDQPPATAGSDRTLPPETTAPAPPAAAPPAPEQPDDLLRRRSGTRQVGAKTFRLVAGEWIDASFDAGALLPVVTVTTDADRQDLLKRVPALAPYAAIADRVTVVHEGTVYRFSS